MNKNQKILIIVTVLAVVAVGGYYAYSQFNLSKTQGYMVDAQNHKKAAESFFSQAESFNSNGDYANALTSYQKSNDEIALALASDRDALHYASGVYKEYIENDIQLLEKTAKLIEYKTYSINFKTGSLNQGQERVDPQVLEPFITNLYSEISRYKSVEEQLINSHPQEFSFLK